jgi:plastocyanin
MRVAVVLFSLLAFAAPAHALPATEITASMAGFTPPVVVVASGENVTWSAIDIPHAANTRDFCFFVGFSPGGIPGKAAFRVAGDTLFAKVGNTPEKPCPQSELLPDGSHALAYECEYHRNMVGLLIVRPA